MNETLIHAGAPALSFAARVLDPLLAHEPLATRHSEEDVRIADRAIRVDVFEPADAARAKTVLLFHGVGGLLGDGPLMRRSARTLAARGFRAGVVHYFNATATLFATHSHVRDHAADWKTALVGVTRHYAQSRGAPVGMMGYSLGGFLAVGAAMELPEVGAVAVMSGGLIEEHENQTPPHVPALLVLHGANDPKIPPERAEALVRLGRRAGARVESVFYPNEGHTLGSRAERDALDRAAQFFAARLGAGARG
ncbi:MAG: dienelactone hydrolase family protein [Terrimicrobiaceae bacterium]|nr:dienelactone hydrolase family protein [Terrimicrobiaceae bacterium]